MCDAFLLFSSRRDGFSLANLYQICSSHKDEAIILIIRNEKQWVLKFQIKFYTICSFYQVFGAYCNESFKVNSNAFYLGNHSTFTFVLEPFEKKFESTILNSNHLRCDLDYFSFGEGGFHLF